MIFYSMTTESRIVLSKCDSGSSASQCVHAPFVFFAINNAFHIIAFLMKYFCVKVTPFIISVVQTTKLANQATLKVRWVKWYLLFLTIYCV